MSRLQVICLALLVSQTLCGAWPWLEKRATPEDRAKALLSQMTLDEKISMVHGSGGDYVGNTPAITRLGIPALTMNDASQGFRGNTHENTTTQYPSLMTLAASFDVDMVREYAAHVAQEFIDKGSNVILGPGMNLARVPRNGRNFEYGTGEDPHLGREVMRTYVDQVQSMGVIATAKHYVNNEQETTRDTVSANLDERTAWELYYQPFMAAVDAGVLSVMCSYNKIGSVWACENNATLNTALKEKMGFKGFVMSDWGAVHSTKDSALHGCDQEMPDNRYFGDALKTAVQSGDIPQAILDEKVYRILYSMFKIGLFDRPASGNFTANVTSDAHYAFARKSSAASTVLLKNDRNVLPIDADKVTTIAVLGDAGDVSPVVGGGGSGAVYVAHVASALEGIKARLSNKNVQVVYATTKPLDKAVAVAKAADIALVFTGTSSSEGSDRGDLSLPADDNTLIQAVAAVNPRTAVIVSSPGAVLLPWADSVPAILAAFLPGQRFGHAIADVLFGVVNPSARLPITFPTRENEVNFTDIQYPGINLQSNYTEGLFIGYRYYDKFNVTPKFAFGHGLSYTTFKYDPVAAFSYKNRKGVSDFAVVAKITNTGSVDGAEVVQLYLGFPESAQEPPKVLRGIKKVNIQAGKSAEARFTVTTQDLSIWDSNVHDWAVIPGDYNIYIGASSRDIRLAGTFKVGGQKNIHSVKF